MQVFYYVNPDKPKRTPEQIAELERVRKRESDAQQVSAKSILEKTGSYLKAEAAHAFTGPAPTEVFEERLRLCLACPGRVDQLDGLTDDGGVGFCTKCGCGANQRSKLSVKLTLAGVECPLRKFKKVKGTGGTIASAVEAAKGVAASAINLMRKNLASDR